MPPIKRFYRFVVESPMRFDGTYGTVHQHYRIDGKLIAVGIVDILPNGLSSVYAFYDPSQHISAFGKYMSLKEIECASPSYCYLGYYIEGCPKMRYKAEYKPSEFFVSYYV
jgi:arginine-tRNA-protein transferase